jgi:hypothetical protein
MRRTREQMRARLMARAESVVDKLLDWSEDTSAPNLTQIEGVVLRLREELSTEMAREVIEAQEAKQLAMGPACPTCGREMRYKGQKAVTPQSWVGEVAFERGYYYCAKCKVGFFPLDEQLGLKDKRYSEGVLKEMVWASGTVDSFAEAESVFERIGHMRITDSSIWRRKEAWGEQVREVEEREREQANLPAGANAFREQVLGSGKRLGVSMDGTMVYVLNEGWKELKVGCAFDIEVSPTWNEKAGEMEDLAHAVHNRYVAHLGGPERLGELLWTEAKQRGWEGAKDREVIGDGAPWIWNLAQDHFYDARQAVDWYHGLEHLAHLATLLHGEGTAAGKQWRKSAQKALYQGHAEKIALVVDKMAAHYAEPVAEELHKEAAYLKTYHRQMQYLELREDGFVIGSGMVESGGKQFKSRFCGPGMRWSRQGLERLIPIRAAIMSDCFDTRWQAAYNLPPN